MASRPTGLLRAGAAYSAARLGLVAVIAVGLVALRVPLVVALLLAVVVALPLSLVVFRGMRSRFTAELAAATGRRRGERQRLRDRLRSG